LQTVPEPIVSYNTTQSYITAHDRNKNYIIGDEIKFNDQFTVLAGGNYAFTGFTFFNQNGTVYGDDSYQKSALTPTVSLIYKVLPWLTTYATYQQSLQKGTAVESTPSTVYTNSGTVLPPYIGNQYEIGAKATVGQNMLLTASLFDIDKANIYTVYNNNNTYTVFEGGHEIHKGIELTASGKITDDPYSHWRRHAPRS
jgi:iron complex outermembrane receptor protein